MKQNLRFELILAHLGSLEFMIFFVLFIISLSCVNFTFRMWKGGSVTGSSVVLADTMGTPKP